MTSADSHGLLGVTLADKYVVESVVGAGGFATVYRAHHLVWQRPVAVKLFNLAGDDSGKHADLVEAFLREGALLAELSERSLAICQARDAGVFTTPRGVRLPYLVLEWLDGMTLADVLEVEVAAEVPPRTMLEALLMLEPAAHALALAHERRIVHRDVKPANIFVLGDPRGRDCTIKLLDFGIAKVLSDAGAIAGDRALTVGPLTAFTPYYAAPEQFSRNFGATGPWTDVYALALVLTEVVTGRDAQAGDDLVALAAVATDARRRPSPRALGAVVSDAVEAVFQSALAIDPQARYPDVATFWAELRLTMGLEPVEPPRSVVAPTSHKVIRASRASAPTIDAPVSGGASVMINDALVARTTQRQHRRALLAVGAVLVVAGGVAVPVAMRHHAGSSKSAPVVAAAPAGARTDGPLASSRRPDACPPTMVSIPGGSFFMGNDDGTVLERPAHQVRVGAFCIDRFEVTAAAYKACSDQGECKRAATTNDWEGLTDRQRKGFDPLCNARDPAERGQHPINCVEWETAAHYCRAQGGRLPTEAEWEFAARGPDGRTYPWGDDPPSARLLNACGAECVSWGREHGEEERSMFSSNDGWATTAPVGSFPAGASRYGVEDVVGNVWEWVDDWFAPYSAIGEPASPAKATEKVIRGGAWNSADPSWVRPTFRYKDVPKKRSYGIGFRCARSPGV